MGKLEEFRSYVEQMVDGDAPFPVDQESHDALHTLSIELYQRVGMASLESITEALRSGDMARMIGAATDGPIAVGCSMFRIGYRLGQIAGAEAISNAQEQLDLMTGENGVIPCTCSQTADRWWVGEHRPPRGIEPACPQWGVYRRRWGT